MRYAFDILTQVHFNHAYFTDNVFNGLNVTVTDATKRLLDNVGLMYKPFKGGFYILYDKNFCNAARTRDEVLRDNLLFEFTLTLTDPLFYNYTANVPQQIDKAVYYFSNHADATLAEPVALHKGQYASVQDVVKLDDNRKHFFNKPFAKLDILARANLALNYYIGFEARQTYWRYILMSDYLQHLNSPAILDDKDSNLFGNALQIDLPDSRKVPGFISNNKLTLSQRYNTRLRLVEKPQSGISNNRDVIDYLPAPDVQYISRLPGSNNDAAKDPNPINYSDIFIY